MGRNRRKKSKVYHEPTLPKSPADLPPLSVDQCQAIETIIQKPGPFFLTGPAGSGKTFVINFLRFNVPNCVVTATTGAAAQLVGGRTLHSFASIHPNYGAVDSFKANQRVSYCDLLIIDEISMCNEQLMEQLDDRFEQAGHTPKVLLVGDFLQLPPVEGVPLFKSRLWSRYEQITLTTQHRQKDSSFISILGDLRLGHLTDGVKAFLQSRRVTALPDDCTHLMAYRDAAENRNLQRLEHLPGTAGCSRWGVTRLVDNEKEISLKNARFLPELRLKIGARVVLLTNTEKWVNGSTGEVVSISHGSVGVNLDRGGTVSVEKVDEEILNGDGKAVCRVTQYPMMLGWSLTIHRAQGMTMDRVGVDLRGHFAPGQTYVALSRCKSSEGLFIVGEVDSVIADLETVARFQ